LQLNPNPNPNPRSHYGNTFASAHQDGTLAVWDRRSGRLIAKVGGGWGGTGGGASGMALLW